MFLLMFHSVGDLIIYEMDTMGLGIALSSTGWQHVCEISKWKNSKMAMQYFSIFRNADRSGGLL